MAIMVTFLMHKDVDDFCVVIYHFLAAFPRPSRTPGDQVCALSIHLQVPLNVTINNIIITTIIIIIINLVLMTTMTIVLFISDVRSTALASVTSMSPYSFDRSAEVTHFVSQLSQLRMDPL